MTDEQRDADPGSPAAITALGWRRWIIIAVVLLAAAGLGATLALLDRDAPAVAPAAAGLPPVMAADPDEEAAAPDTAAPPDGSSAAQATSDEAPPELAPAPVEPAPVEPAPVAPVPVGPTPAEQATAVEDADAGPAPAEAAAEATAEPEPAAEPVPVAEPEDAAAPADEPAAVQSTPQPEATYDEPPSDAAEESADGEAPAVEPPQAESVARPRATPSAVDWAFVEGWLVGTPPDEPPPARPASTPETYWAELGVWALAAPKPAAAAAPPAPAPPSAPAPVTVDIGPFAMPIAGACFPEFAGQLPGAPRDYRNGIHEGVDFYPGWACAEIVLGTPVLAVGEGRVIRADWDYEDLTDELYWEMEARDFAGPDDLDIFRGRQVWVDHGDGVVARYAHLSGIAEGIAEGAPVTAGDVVGFIGESGTPGGVREPGSEIHLHFELRIGDGYLGERRGPERALARYRAAFTAEP